MYKIPRRLNFKKEMASKKYVSPHTGPLNRKKKRANVPRKESYDDVYNFGSQGVEIDEPLVGPR